MFTIFQEIKIFISLLDEKEEQVQAATARSADGLSGSDRSKILILLRLASKVRFPTDLMKPGWETQLSDVRA